MKKNLLALGIFYFAFLLIFSIFVFGIEEEQFNEKWNYTTGGMITDLCIGDFDNDGKKEIATVKSIETLVGSGGDFRIVNSTGNLIWKKDIGCKIYSIFCEDIDNDGYDEILVGSCTHLHVFNYTQEKEWQFFTDHGAVKIIFPFDFDNDGKKELLIATTDPMSKRNNNIYLVDNRGQLIWKKNLPSSPNSIDVKDINSDGLKDIIVASGISSIGISAYKGWITVYNENGTLQWEVRIKNGAESVKITEINRDKKPEIIVGSLYTIYLFDSNGNEKKQYNISGHAYALEVINAKDEILLIVGTNDLIALDSNFKFKWSYNTADEVYDIKIFDIDNDGNEEIFAVSDRVYLLSNGGKLLWQSPKAAGVKKIVIDDLENDKYNEIIFGTLDGKIYVYETKGNVKGKLAEENFLKAEKAFNAGNYDNSTNYAKIAKKLYEELNMNSKAKECDELIKKINAIISEDLRNKKEADENYNKSMNFFMNENFSSALTFARKAKLLYSGIKKKTPEIEKNIENCDIIVKNSIDGLKLRAALLYENATYLYGTKNYGLSLNLSREILDIGILLKDKNISLKANLMIANSLCKISEIEYRESRIESAVLNAKEAIEIYNELGNETAGNEILECSKILEKIEKKQSYAEKPKEVNMSNITIILIVLILAIFLAVFFIRKKHYIVSKDTTKTEVENKVEAVEIKTIDELKEKSEKKELEPIKKDKFKGIGRSLKPLKL
ncbi:MAG: FG-GAP-like repeat-containing protein [Candidatus Altiarchaeota archaeon]